ncbi:MAG: hypothetical protein EP324_08145 [Gammaproteobacteria bacterium]|nr:MAG: hypothetical protein EP324_08145 [Gammaproteobacteria bacterium]
MESLIIRSQDFSRQGADGIHMPKKQENGFDPCTGCEHRQRCTEEYLACDRYAGYLGPGDSYVAPSKYMGKSGYPTRANFVRLFGDDGLPPVKEKKPRPEATRAELMAALDAAREAQYPPLPPKDEDPQAHFVVKNRIGTYRQWRNRQDKIIWTLVEKLRKMQGA